jgi:flavodoxin
MKRLVVYYSLSGNTEVAAKKIADKLGADLLKIDTVKPMPKSFAAQIIVGGGQVMMNYVPKLKTFDKDPSLYDEIILGSPIWNSKGVPAINAFLKDEKSAVKVTSLFFLSGGGEIQKGLDAITRNLPNLKNSISLLDKKHENSKDNDVKIDQFVSSIVEKANDR